ncbi:MAG: hypothetical protein WEE64_09170 [Dehalococcoidia bacterium]
MPREPQRIHRSERGHISVTFASLFSIAGAVLLAVGLSGDNDGLAIAGAVSLGLATLVGVNGPHLWVRRIYQRLDRMAPDDPAVHPGKIRIEL